MRIDRRNFCLWDLTHLGALEIAGKDAKKLLQGQLTCNMEKIDQTHSSLAALCNPQGRIISLFYIGMLNDSYYLIMPREMVTLTQNALKKYAVFYKVSMQDVSDMFTIIGVQNATPPDADNLVIPVSETRYIVFNTSEKIKSFWSANVEQATVLENSNWQTITLQEKIPQIFPATSTKILPHEINLPALDGVDFNKGCYTGQEIIARMHYRGKVKTFLYLAELTAQAPEPNAAVMKETPHSHIECGIVIDAVMLNTETALVLFITDTESAQNNLFIGDKPLSMKA